ncbi:cysteine--tRNA ligase [Candidatus Berkelbacteria bacterium]|nr:cysteine--tRNA ligase [Candidatus Berkelbacteria bacterium]
MLQIYNTLTSSKEEFQSIQPKKVGMYVCGPTVYDYDHIGHARTYLSFDLLNRFLRYSGYDVTYIQNITDVGHLVNDAEVGADKLQQKAHELGKSVSDIAHMYTDSHLEDLRSLNILSAANFPKASEHIQEIVEFIQGLIENNYAYVTNQNNIYFSVTKKADYGKLSHRTLAEVITGTRVDSAKDKRNPADFALWKASPVMSHEFVWDSPWGRGYPGWHIECSAMIRKYLGDTFDIHGSAVEHVFPHHENEIAQSEALTNKPMANYWVHAGMLTINGQKMSKSVHNTVLVKDALKEYSANELKLALYGTHYRKPFDYTKESLAQGVALRHKLFMAYANTQENANTDAFNRFIEALNDDLDTPKALQILSTETNDFNKEQFEQIFEILGLKHMSISNNPALQELVAQREQARSGADYLTADNRKKEIEQAGFEVLDTPEGTVYLSR